jgi:hypothetical protein
VAPGVLCRRFSAWLTDSGWYRAISTGKAQRREMPGIGTASMSTTHLCPHSQAVNVWELRTASRCFPFPYTLSPGCSVTVVSQMATTGSSAGIKSMTKPASSRPTFQHDQ